MSGYHLSAFDVGQVKAHMHHGLSAAAISRIMRKSDGLSQWDEKSIQRVVDKLVKSPRWRGERAEGSGQPRKTTAIEDRTIVKCVFEKRGREKVIVPGIKRKFPRFRPLSDTLVAERLHDADLAYLRRRRKSKIGRAYLQERIEYCLSTLRKHQSTLDRWAYTDGTVWYLDRTREEFEQSQQAALGPYVWRLADGKDALFQDCLGPSSYWKAQGTAVRVWGLLACGALHVHVLEEGEAMNQDLYGELVDDRFEDWAGNCTHLVQDFERCLRTESSVHAITKAGFQLVEDYPRCSQDFNAIENCWKLLKERLLETMPRQLEHRDAFIRRLRSAVAWLNRHKSEELWYLSTNQKERARDCLSAVPPGGRTKW